MHLDPAFKELAFRRTGSIDLEQIAEVGGELVPVVARLQDPGLQVAGLNVVARFGSVLTGRVSMHDIARVRADPNVQSLKMSRTVHKDLAVSVPDIGAGSLAFGAVRPRGRAVVVAVLDWGCDFVHANFRRANGRTRLLALWDQRGGPQASSPPSFGYGRQWSRDEIDAALSSADPYGALGYDPLEADPEREGTHGTHVLDIVAGNGNAAGAAPGVAPEAELLFVHLAGTDTAADDNLGDSVRLLEAVRYAFDCAGDRPAVVSMSLGQHGGPHDGSTLFEQGLDALLAERAGRAVAMSTGNYFSAGVHAEGRLERGGTLELPFDLPRRSTGAAEVDVWYAGGDRFVAELLDPAGRTVATVRLGEDAVVDGGAGPIATIYHRPFDPNNGNHHIDVFLHPNAEAGRWVLRLYGEQVRDGRVHAWVERDARATQARFAEDVVSRTTTTNTVCNGSQTIAVGAYDARDEQRAVLPFSSVGPTRDGRQKPDLIAPGGGVVAARSSRLEGGRRTRDELVAKSGTSMAAPHVAGTIALMFEVAGDEKLSIAETREILLSTARKVHPADPLDAQRYGNGMVDAARAVEATLALRHGGLRIPTVEEMLAAVGVDVWSPTPARTHATARRPNCARTHASTRATTRWPASRASRTKERPMRRLTQSESIFEWLQDGPDSFDLENASGCLAWLTEPPAIGTAESMFEAVTYVRKNAFALTRKEVDAIVAALTALSATDLWYRYAELHDAVAFGAASVHGMFRQRELGTVAGTAAAYHRFLPWHRLFLWDFEQQMRRQAGGANAFIPYWDWTVAAQRRLPSWLSRVPTSLVQPGSSTRFAVTRDVTVTTPPVDPDDDALPTRAAIEALMVSDRGIDPRTGREVATTTFDTFTAALERLHGPPHGWVGGTMNGTFSPVDFMFFMHHCQVDRLWATWQGRFPSRLPSLTGGARDLPRVGGSTVRFDTVLDVTALGFDYDAPWR